jgi:hypothetical protein
LPTRFVVLQCEKNLPAREFGGLRQATRTEIEFEFIEKSFCHAEIGRKRRRGFSVVQLSFCAALQIG